jgi:CRP-like cAMP-binding protein
VNELPTSIRNIGAGRACQACLGLDCLGEQRPSDLPWTGRKFAPRQHIFHQGDDQRYVYFLQTGFVRLYSLLSNGRCQVIGFKSADDFVALEYGLTHRFSAQAVTATELRSVPTAAFYAAASGDPQLLLKLYNVVCEDLARSHDLVLSIAKRDAEGSMAAFLLDIDARASAPSVKNDFVLLPMLRGDIADYLGLTNETVSRIFIHFKKRGFIQVRGRHGIRLTDRRGLRALSDRIACDRKSAGLESPRLASPPN